MNLITVAAICCSATATLAQPAAMDPPARPLFTHDPYFSVWSMSEKLTDDWPRHWSRGTMGMSGLIRVDGKTYRWCGPAGADGGAPDVDVVTYSGGWGGVTLDQTFYNFEAGGVHVIVEFRSQLGLADDPVKASRSVSSITWRATSHDKLPHEVRVYLDLSGEWCTNDPSDHVSAARHRVERMEVLSLGKVEQPVLQNAGDQRKIDWGRVYLAGSSKKSVGTIAGDRSARSDFAQTGKSRMSDDLRFPRAANDDWPVIAMVTDLGKIEPGTFAEEHLLVGYDEREAIELFGRQLKPLWAHTDGADFAAQLTTAEADYAKRGDPLKRRAENQFWTAAVRVGGDRYAKLLTLAFRQVMAGHKIVADWDGTPMMFSKENTSNGCIATVDVIYPACPFFLYHNPAMLRAQLLPLMQYSASPRWKFPFAPHDLGTYPKANGQVYGGGERDEQNQMPVEESGNMLIMLAALVKIEPQESIRFCEPYWPTLERWAVYLKDNGLDPANQLCTDDFAGHLARNVNLSAKTVVALGGYAQLLRASGKTQDADRWQAVAQDYAKKWMETAKRGEATSLVFGDAGDNTWSQKYNLIWDRALGLNLFPQEVFDRETALYRARLQKYGLPLDSRRTYTKLDWTCWSACLSGKREDFDAVMAPVLDWANASPPPSRVPLSDWYETTNGKTMGMHTRTVVGGLWMPLLIDKLRNPDARE